MNKRTTSRSSMERQHAKIIAELVTLTTLLARQTTQLIENQQPKEEAPKTDSLIDARDITRALLLARESHNSAIQEAIRRYQHVLKDVHEVGQDEEIANDVGKRFNRYRVYHYRDLELLGVAIIDVQPGSVVDSTLHEVEGVRYSSTADSSDTIAEVLTPLFKWKDSSNTEQIVPAKVVAFAEDDDAELNGHSPND